jgi:hypothetical protein
MRDEPNDEYNRSEAFLRGAVELEGQIAQAAAAIREESKIAYGSSLLDGRLVLLAIINELVALRAGQAGSTSDEISERLALTVAAVQGAGSTETLISEGQYVKAAAALRQDLEIVARLREVDEGLSRDGKVANVKHGSAGSGPVYGYLSGVAHVAKPGVINGLLARVPVGDTGMGIGIVPEFNEEAAVGFYEWHVWLLLTLTREMIRLHSDLYGDADPDGRLARLIQAWLSVQDHLQKAGHIREPD